MAKRFEDDELNKWLDEQFIEEAEAMEKLIFAEEDGDDYETTDEETLKAFDDLVARLKADGVYREDEIKQTDSERVVTSDRMTAKASTEPENAVIEEIAASAASPEEKIIPMPAKNESKESQTDSKGEETEEPRRKGMYTFARVACMFLVCMSCLFGATMTSEANRKYVVNQFRVLTGDNTRVVVDNDETNETINNAEYLARDEIEEKLGIELPRFLYRPHGLEYYKYSVYVDSGIARIEYWYDGDIMTLLIDVQSERSSSDLLSFHGEKLQNDLINVQDIEIEVKSIKDEQDNGVTSCAQWKNDDIAYAFFGKMEFEELIKIVEYIRF